MMRLVTAAVAFLLAGWAQAAPYVPKDESTVIERLPGRLPGPAAAELKRLRLAHAARPHDSATAADLARRFFELAMAQGDARYVGYAEGVLRHWAAGDAPAEVLFIRALLRQYRHDFAGGLRDLAAALQRDPELVGARAWRAAIFMVQADYAAARKECAALEEHASELLATGCSAYVEATVGNARSAYERLARVLATNPGSSTETRLWALTRLAEIGWRLGDASAAERHFRDALALGVTDNYLLAAYADFLLEQDRPNDVMVLLQDWSRSDTLLLRLALAARALKLPAAEGYVKALAARFAAAARRGERLHLQEEARFLLHLQNQPEAALQVAVENWKTQREPRDAAVLIEAAIAAREPRAAEPALRWMDETKFESIRLRRLATRVR